MLEIISAKPIKENELGEDNVFELKRNTPKQITKDNNAHVAHILEDKENEHLYIHSAFEDNEFAVICNEFALNFLKDPKRVDLSYYFFSETNQVTVFLYDMKKTFAGIDVLIHLVEQWKSSIDDAEYCIKKLSDYGNYEIADIFIGVITEDNDAERRNKEIASLSSPDSTEPNIPSFIKSKHLANTADNIRKANLLKGLDEGRITISGKTYSVDVRVFIDKRYDMYFERGRLAAT